MKFTRTGKAGIAIDNVRLISMIPGVPDAEDARAVLVIGDRIVQVRAAGELSAPEGVRIVNARGLSLVPGLIPPAAFRAHSRQLLTHLPRCAPSMTPAIAG